MLAEGLEHQGDESPKLSLLPLNFIQQAFINGDEFLSHLQIWYQKCVNIHKCAMNSKNVHNGDFKRKQG